MQPVRKMLYLIAILLLLEVIKTLLQKMEFNVGYLLATAIMSLQIFMGAGFVFILIFRKLYKGRYRKTLPIVSFLIFVALIETLFSWWSHHTSKIPAFLQDAFKYYYYHYEMNIIQYQERLAAYHPQLFYTLKPNTSSYYENFEFVTTVATNRLGLRDDNKSLNKPSVICLGDSYTMGWGVEQQETFPELLQSLTGRTVLNAGISSYGTAREVILYDKLDTSDLEYVVIQYCSNDYAENTSYIKNRYRLKISDSCNYHTLVRNHELSNKYFPGKRFLTIAQIFLKQQINRLIPVFNMEAGNMKPVPQYNDKDRHAKVFLDILRHSRINFQKIKVIVVHLEDYAGMQDSISGHIRKLLQQPEYKEHFGGNLLIADISGDINKSDFFCIDAHMKPSGCRKVAEKIAGHVALR